MVRCAASALATLSTCKRSSRMSTRVVRSTNAHGRLVRVSKPITEAGPVALASGSGRLPRPPRFACLVCLLVAALSAFAMLATPWVTPAAAVDDLSGPLWAVPAPDWSSTVEATSAGNVIVDSCEYTGQERVAAQMFARDSSTLWNFRSTLGCPAIVDKQGNTYLQTQDSPESSTIQSLDPAGRLRWTASAAGLSPSPSDARVALGSNGNVYFAEWTGSPAGPILGFDRVTGAKTFDKTFDVAYALYAYSDGLVLVSDHDVEYIGYDGTRRNAYSIAPRAHLSGAVAPGVDGTVYLGTLVGGTCTANQGTNAVSKVTPRGVAWTWTQSAPHRCSTPSLSATPDGGVVVADAAPNSPRVSLTHLNAAGVPTWTHAASGSASAPNDFYSSRVDVGGNVLFATSFDYDCPSGPRDPCTGTRFELLSSNGVPLQPAFQVTDPADGRVIAPTPPAIDIDRVYLLTSDSGARERTLAALAAPGLGVDYRLKLRNDVEGSGPPAPPPPPQQPPSSPPAPGLMPTRIASLGDSYSSGEGLRPEQGLRYDCGTDLFPGRYYTYTTVLEEMWWRPRIDCDTRTGSTVEAPRYFTRPVVRYHNECHRHGLAYPNQIRTQLRIPARSGIFVACSGAVTAHVVNTAQYPQSPPGVHAGRAQLQTVRDFAARAGDPDLITVGVGGNDAGFADILKTCLTQRASCTSDARWRRDVLSNINEAVFVRVRATLRRLSRTFSSAAIYAFGYPSVIGDPRSDCAGMHLYLFGWKLDHAERSWLKHEVLSAINDTISDAASEAGVTYVDITPATRGHEVCSKDGAWVNGARLGADDGYSPIAVESFHPNQHAHDAIAPLFTQKYTDGAGRLTDGAGHPLLRNPPESAAKRIPSASSAVFGTVSAGAVSSCGSGCLRPAPCVRACDIRLQGTGYVPGSTLTVRLQSRLRRLGRAHVRADGTVLARLRLPKAIKAGGHGVELRGVAPDGTRQYGVASFEVFRKRPRLRGGRRPILSVRIGAPRRQPFHGAIVVTCRTTVPASCTGTARVRASGRSFRAKGARRARAGRRTRLVLRFLPAATNKIRRELERGSLNARVSVTARRGITRATASQRIQLR